MIIKTNSDSKVSVVVIGQGEHAIDKIIPALKLSNLCQIDCLVGRNLDKLEINSKRFDIPSFSDDWQYVLKNLDSNKPTNVVLASLPSVHYEVAKYCLAHNINVFIEKPPALNYQQMTELETLERESESVVMVGYNFSFSLYTKLLKICPDPLFGSFNFVVGKMTTSLDGFKNVLETVLYKAIIHPLHTIYQTFGKVTNFSVTYTDLKNNKFSLDFVFNFSGGRNCHLHTGNYSNKFECDFKLINHESVVSLNSLSQFHGYGVGFKDDFNFFKNKQDFQFSNSPTISGYENSGYQTEINTWINAVKSGNKETGSIFKDSLYLYKLIEEIKNQLIHLPIIDNLNKI